MGTKAVSQREYIGTLGALTVPGLDTIVHMLKVSLSDRFVPYLTTPPHGLNEQAAMLQRKNIKAKDVEAATLHRRSDGVLKGTPTLNEIADRLIGIVPVPTSRHVTGHS